MTIGRVVVTGGASGLGAALVDAVLERGGEPAVIDVKPPRASVPFALADVSDTASVELAVESCVADLGGGIDAVVTAAGIDRCGALLDVPAADWEQVIRVNLLGTASVVRACLPHLLASGGHAVTIASTLGLRSLGDASAYCASKAGVVGFSRALMRELEGQVAVTLVLPGGMDTAFFDGRPAQYRPAPDADLASPDAIALAIVAALDMPRGSVIRELMVTPATEPSWP